MSSMTQNTTNHQTYTSYRKKHLYLTALRTL